MNTRTVFITGGTGYIGRRLIPRLLQRGHKVCALVRNGSKVQLPFDCTLLIGNALDGSTFINQITPADTFVQLVGVSHPNPVKGEEFRRIDLASVYESVTAAKVNNIQHFIYVSVAQPSPIMKEYVAARAEGEKVIRESGMNATFIRPWYVLGPGRRWPSVLVPMYWLLERIPATSESAKRLGLVTIDQMVATLAAAIENPAKGVQIVKVPQIRSGSVQQKVSTAET